MYRLTPNCAALIRGYPCLPPTGGFENLNALILCTLTDNTYIKIYVFCVYSCDLRDYFYEKSTKCYHV